jgi:hypothetical protein
MHRKGIAFEDLPKTFQDFVEFAQSIGIRYVWIDSLCIIQGNSQDWHSEAAKMGNVYRNAALVIAASGAKDSSQGLFISNRSARVILRLPYRTGAKVHGTFNMMRSPEESGWHPTHGPLESRAWTLQERYLARRLITFMPHGITWSCKTQSVDEGGEPMCDFDRTKDWFGLLREYTKRSLTFPSDRTEAIRGVAEDPIRWSRKDQYIPDYGVWKDKLLEQLLWSKHGPCFDDTILSNKPSWSWAATESAKVWPLEFSSNWQVPDLETMPEELMITHEGYLHVLGHLSTAKPASSYVRQEYTVSDPPVRKEQRVHLLWKRHYDTWPQLLKQDIKDSYDHLNLGSACFDNDSITSYSHAWFLGKHLIELEPLHVLRSFVEREFIVRIFRFNSIAKTKIYQDEVVHHTKHRPDFIYWALLLEQVDESKYRRVGIAALLSVAYEASLVQLQKFKII